MSIREEMPLLARHEGEWEGEYIWVDADGNVTDRHATHLACTFPDTGEWPYYQVNTYTWPDGRTEVIHFPATYKDRNIWFDTDRINGHAWEVDERTICLTWTRKDDPGGFFYEMIQLDETGTKRSRVWQWFEDGVCTKRTLINEHRVA
ncbi:hypothetical protein [Yinghuangia seranimata]|uniref:hypothetical protein n=1 Tax=Yinghuangia seranimata TaxID=408067 RepID=UPI00248BCFBC|nr:hypothetical protein [Yinghuangia seranimata]MDI2131876.1 hypothetical protein [Yinghuangia seranimata]